MFHERTEVLKSFDGTNLFFRCFTPSQSGQQRDFELDGLVVHIHGFAEHSGRYAHVAEVVNKHNMAFVCFDLRGHGKSGNKRGDVENIHAMLTDIVFVVNHARSLLGLYNRSDIFFGLSGHSFGGLLAIYTAAMLDKLCPPLFLSSPCIKFKVPVPNWKKKLAQSMPRVLPTLPISLPDLSPDLSNNPANNKAYKEDPLILRQVSARFGNDYLEFVNPKLARQSVDLVRAPVSVLAGSQDKIVDLQETEALFTHFTSQGSFTVIQGAGHEVYNETSEYQTQALAALNTWIQYRGYPKGSAP